MRVISKRSGVRFLVALLAASASSSAIAQQQPQQEPSQQQQSPAGSNIVVYGESAPAMTEGPEVKGVIVARNDDKMKVKTADGNSVVIAVNDSTRIKAGGGLFSSTSKLGADSLLNGLPVTVKTMCSRPESRSQCRNPSI